MTTLTQISVVWLSLFFCRLFVSLIAQPMPGAAQLKGTATYPVIEALLPDVAEADALAVVASSVRIEKPGQVPPQFEIPHDPARIDQSHRHSVRTHVTTGQRLLFRTDQVYPARGQGNEVQTLLRMVAASKPATKPAPAAPLGVLPASFIGEPPCADCPGIRYHVNLFSDRVYFLRTTYIGRADGATSDDIGSWSCRAIAAQLSLKGHVRGL